MKTFFKLMYIYYNKQKHKLNSVKTNIHISQFYFAVISFIHYIIGNTAMKEFS
jgi:hypothetical protein